MADYDAVLNEFPLRFSCGLVGTLRTSPELPVPFYSMIHALFIVRTMEVYLAPFVNRIRFCSHSHLTLFWSLCLRSACMKKTKAKPGKDKRSRSGESEPQCDEKKLVKNERIQPILKVIVKVFS